MIVEARVNSVINIDIESDEAFVILCKTLQMDFVLDEDIEFFVRQDSFGDNCVYYIKDGHDEKYDERGDLFVALRNVAVQLFPNISFRNANYICKKE